MRDNSFHNNRYHRIMSQRTPTQQDVVSKSSAHVKINFLNNINGNNRLTNNGASHNSIKQKQQNQQQQYKSQRYSCKHYNRQQSQSKLAKKSPFTKPKIYRSYSQSKNTNNNMKKVTTSQLLDVRENRQNEDFVIRVPKNEDLIENYIQQLKQLKRKVAQERKQIGQLKNKKLQNCNNNGKKLQINQQLLMSNANYNNSSSRQKFSLKLPGKQQLNQYQYENKNNFNNSNKDRVSFFIQDRQVLGLIRKTQQIRTTNVTTNNTNKNIANTKKCDNNYNKNNSTSKITTNEKKIFSRDMKKHIKKLKMFKEFVDENGQNDDGQNQNDIDDYHNQQKNTNSHSITSKAINNLLQNSRSPMIQPYYVITNRQNININQANIQLTNQQQQQKQQQLIYKQSTSIPLFYPKKVVYGNVINVKQEFNIKQAMMMGQKKEKRIATTHRYSTEGNGNGGSGSGRRLYSVSKSVDIRKHIKTGGRYGNQSTDGDNITNNNNTNKITNKCKSLMLRRKTQQTSIKTNRKQSNDLFQTNTMNNMKNENSIKRPLRPINFIHHHHHTNNNNSIVVIKNEKQNTILPQKPHTQRSPTKNNASSSPKKTSTIVVNSASPSKKDNTYSHLNKKSPQKTPKQHQQQNPFNSIQGYSTIEDRKQTLDILGESCLQIKHNLIQSHKKMEHILDLLQENMIGLESGHKEKRRKSSYERFSKAFPKGFFK